MSAEWWGPPCDLLVRLVVCGHVVLEREVPAPSIDDELKKFECPECGISQSTISKHRDGVPHESGEWGEARCVKRRDLCSQGPIRRLEDLLQAMSTPGTVHICLVARTLLLGRSLQNQGPAEGLVLRAWPAGCTVTGGTLQLPHSAVLLLTGRGVLFQDTRFSGGVLVVCGADFSATFNGCEFNGCTLYVVHGAAAMLRRCTLHSAFHGAFHGAVAHGAGSTLHLDTCTMARCIRDVTAERGATVTAHQSLFTGSNASCVARDGDSGMSFSACSFVGGQPCGRWGVEAQGSRVLLQGCSIENFSAGAVAIGASAVVEVHKCHVSAPDPPVCALEGAKVLIRESLMRVSGQAQVRSRHPGSPGTPGMLLRADRASVQIERCSLSAPGERDNGVHVREHAVVAMVLSDVVAGGLAVSVRDNGRRAIVSHCSVRSEHTRACLADTAGGVIRVAGGRVAGAVAAAACIDGGEVSLREAVLRGVSGPCSRAPCVIEALHNGTARLRCCAVQHAEQGVLVHGGHAFASDVVVSDLKVPASKASSGHWATAYTQAGGSLSVVRGAVTGCTLGVCVMPDPRDGSPADARVEGASFMGNGVGVRVCQGSGCEVTVAGCDFHGGAERVRGPDPGLQEQVAVAVENGSHRVWVRDSTFTSTDHDVYCGESHIEISQCDFLGSRPGGRSVVMLGSGTVRACRFTGSKCGLVANGANISVERCSFAADVTQGCVVDAAADASISDCQFSGCKESILALAGAEVRIADTHCTGGAVGLSVYAAAAVSARRLTVMGGTDAVHIQTDCKATPHVALTDCVVKGASNCGVRLNSSLATVALERCRLEACPIGICIVAGSSACVRNTNMSHCEVAVTAGMPEVMLSNQCDDCGRGGDAAVARAWHALRAAGAAGVAGAMCPHDGGFARASLEDVEVEDCRWGLQVSAAGSVTARRVRVRGAERAFTVTRFGDPNVFEDCVASGRSAQPVVAGRMLGPEQGYLMLPEAIAGISVVAGSL